MEEGNTGDAYNSHKGSLMVYAAAGLSDVIQPLADLFASESGTRLQLNLASSGTLARQIEMGEVPDIYISASPVWTNYIDSLGFMTKGSKRVIARNELVLVTPLNSSMERITEENTLPMVLSSVEGFFSMGDPAHVPAGSYSKQVLNSYGLFEHLTQKMLYAKDVRSALMMVELEEAVLGIVYRTDAQKSDKVRVIYTFPETVHEPILFVACICIESHTAREFIDFLTSAETAFIWEKNGFLGI